VTSPPESFAWRSTPTDSVPASLAADVVVVGAGPAGIAAAVRAADAGQRVILLDESPNAGGQI